MFPSMSRRGFLGLAPVVPFVFDGQSPAVPQGGAAPAAFPQQAPELVREAVGVSHNNLARLKELVSARPALARASWDWGFGDWETAIDAASHVGNRPIADYLIANGARPTIFTAAMMGQLAIVKSWVEAMPGVQRTRGPHGGAAAAEVLKYLESLGDANPAYPNVALTDAETAAILGDYTFGTGASERLTVAKNARGIVTIQRPGFSERNMSHEGNFAFIPAGAEAVRVRFDVAGGQARAMTVEDGPFVLRAPRPAAP
jgi:uncharacterized protein YaiE (UPF0345 family)